MSAHDLDGGRESGSALVTVEQPGDGSGSEHAAPHDDAAAGGTHEQTTQRLWSETLRVLGLWKDELARRFAGWMPAPAGTAGTAGSAGAPGGRSDGRMGRHLYRSRRDRMIRGVCAGLADYLGVPVALVRLGFVLLFFTGVVHAVIPYVLLAILVPEEPYDIPAR